MPEETHFSAHAALAGPKPARWYQRPGIAAAAFAAAALALVAAVATAPSDPLPRVAQAPRPAGVVLPPNATPSAAQDADAAAASGAEPSVLGSVEESDDPSPSLGDDAEEDESVNPLAGVAEELAEALTSAPIPAEILDISLGGQSIPAEQPAPATIVNGVVRTSWTFDGAAVAAVEAGGQFITVTLVLNGPVGFDSTASAVVEVRCLSGDCPPGWTEWTPLPVGVVDPNIATTLVARSELAREARFELRPRPDPSIYVIS